MADEHKEIYCCGCEKKVEARLTNGKEVYSHRRDLYTLPFWICDFCDNFVGCHYKDKKNPTVPLGAIATQEIKNIRMSLHRRIDHVWKNGHMSRHQVYALMSKEIGYSFHASHVRSTEEANNCLRVANDIFKNFPTPKSVYY